MFSILLKVHALINKVTSYFVIVNVVCTKMIVEVKTVILGGTSNDG